jgi:hypothetical protein
MQNNNPDILDFNTSKEIDEAISKSSGWFIRWGILLMCLLVALLYSLLFIIRIDKKTNVSGQINAGWDDALTPNIHTLQGGTVKHKDSIVIVESNLKTAQGLKMLYPGQQLSISFDNRNYQKTILLEKILNRDSIILKVNNIKIPSHSNDETTIKILTSTSLFKKIFHFKS